MANIGTWSVRILANTFGFDRKIEASKRKTNAFSASIGMASTKLQGFGSAIAGAFGVGAIKSYVHNQLDVIDSLAKTSSKLGVEIDQLQTMQYAAKLSGVSTETLNMALQRLVRKLGEAKRGGAEATKAFSLFGLNARELAQMEPFEAFTELLKAAQNLSQSSRVDVFQKVFDSEGVGLVNMVGLNLVKVNRELEKMGVLMARSDAKTIEDTNDELTKMQAQLDAIGGKLTIGIAPAIIKIAEGFSVANENLQAMAKSLGIKELTARSLAGKLYGASGEALNAATLPFQILFDEEQRKRTASGIIAKERLRRMNQPGTRLGKYRYPEQYRGQLGVSGEDRSSGQDMRFNSDFGRDALQYMKRQTFSPVLAPSVDY